MLGKLLLCPAWQVFCSSHLIKLCRRRRSIYWFSIVGSLRNASAALVTARGACLVGPRNDLAQYSHECIKQGIVGRKLTAKVRGCEGSPSYVDSAIGGAASGGILNQIGGKSTTLYIYGPYLLVTGNGIRYAPSVMFYTGMFMCMGDFMIRQITYPNSETASTE